MFFIWKRSDSSWLCIVSCIFNTLSSITPFHALFIVMMNKLFTQRWSKLHFVVIRLDFQNRPFGSGRETLLFSRKVNSDTFANESRVSHSD